MGNPVAKITPFFKDDRGTLSHLLDKEMPFKSAVLITSKKGAIRANHYHKSDTHYSYILKGSMEYTYKKVGQKGKGTTVVARKGDVVITPPMTVHAMRFLENSEFIALTTEARDQEKYEKDTVRVRFVE